MLAIVVLLFYIKKKMSDVFDLVEKNLNNAKQIVKHPKEIASAVGEAVVDTAVSQVAKMTRGKKRRK
jgi:hypothetical protein